MVTSTNRVPKIAFDTNMIIGLSRIYFNRVQSKTLTDKERKHNRVLQEYLKMMENKEIEVIILPTVLEEVKAISSKFDNLPLNYLYKSNSTFYRYQPTTIAEEKNFAKDVFDLAEMYCQPKEWGSSKGLIKQYYTVLKNKHISFKGADKPFFRRYNNHPSFDARIMAEASVLNLNLITHDYDFVEGNLPEKIQAFNYAYNKKKSKPFEAEEFLTLLYRKKNLQINFQKQHIDTLIPAH